MTQAPRPAPKIDALDSMLCLDIYAAQQAFGHVYKPLLESYGLTYLQYVVLRTLWPDHTRTVGEIGSALGLGSNTLTPLLKRMEAAGLVTRTRDAEDERRVVISLTEAGAALETRTLDVPRQVFETLGVTLEQARDLQATLRRMTVAMTAPPRT
jgi:DNA-binding MarR family transcriptional regulator